MVFVAHSYDLSRIDGLYNIRQYVSSTLAVQMFFVISGFLIFQSYTRSRSIGSYAKKRIKRVYPAYVTIIAISAIVLPVVGTMTVSEYIYDVRLYKYIGANLIFMNFLAPELPGIFQGNEVQAVNGALWTLKVELGFYVFVPICIWIFTKIGRLKTLLLFYALSVIYSYITLYIAESRNMDSFIEISRQMPGQMTYFIAGAILFYYFDYFKRYILPLTILGIGIFCLSFYTMDLILRPVGLALGGMGVAFGPYLGRFGKYGDFSYGIYIVHFPILQTLISLRILQDNALAFVLLAASIVLVAAALMWHLVEKVFLRRSSHYRQEEVAAVAT